jgi:hypothetical protein
LPGPAGPRLSPNLSKAFPQFSKFFQGFSKNFQSFSKDFQRNSLAEMSLIKGLRAKRGKFAL